MSEFSVASWSTFIRVAICRFVIALASPFPVVLCIVSLTSVLFQVECYDSKKSRSVIDHRRRQNVVTTSVTHLAINSRATFLFLEHFDVICDQLLNRRTATWNPFVKYIVLMVHVFHYLTEPNSNLLKKRLVLFERLSVLLR